VQACAVIVAGGEVAQAGDYQSYVKGLPADYQQYLGQGAESSKGMEYHKYMAAYAGEYQKYMSQKAGGSNSGDYQTYMKNYVRGGSNYPSYMQSFATDYQKFVQQGGDSNAQGGSYSEYLKDYADTYQNYVQKYTNNAGDKANPGNYQQYSKDYTGDHQKYMSQSPGGGEYMKSYASAYHGFWNQGTSQHQPSQLLASANSLDAVYAATQAAQKDDDTKKQAEATQEDNWKSAFKSKYAKQYSSFKSAQDRLSEQFKDVPSKASDCETLEQLDKWLEAETARIDFYVPQEYSGKALHCLQEEYAKRAAQIIEGKAGSPGKGKSTEDKKDKVKGAEDAEKKEKPSKDDSTKSAKSPPAPKPAKGSDDSKTGTKQDKPTDGKKSGGGLFGGLFGGGLLAAENPAQRGQGASQPELLADGKPTVGVPVGAAALASVALLSLIAMIVQRRRMLVSKSDTALQAPLIEEP